MPKRARRWRRCSRGSKRRLERHGDGPFFNGAGYSLVDAGYAPFLQRYLIVEEISGDALSKDFSRLRRWAEALVDRASTHSLPPEEFRALSSQT